MTDRIQTRGTAGVTLPSGEDLPCFGLRLGEPSGPADRMIASLRTGIDLGLTVVELTPDAEEVVAEAIRHRRGDLFLICRPDLGRRTAGRSLRESVLVACQESLNRLGTDRIDLYLWQRADPTPPDEVVDGFNLLVAEGLIRHWGVADFAVPDLVELTAVPGGTAVEANQVEYDLAHREIEAALLPRCRAARLPVLARVAPEPVDWATGPDGSQTHPALATVARRLEANPGQVGLAWLLRQPGVYALVPAETPEGVRRHHSALRLDLSPQDLAELARALPARAGPRPPVGIPGPPPSEA